MSDKIKALGDLQKTLVSFFDELIEMFPKEGSFVAIRIMIKDRIPITTISEHFVKNLIPEKEVVKARDTVFFDRNPLVSALGDSHAQNFKKLFFSLDTEDQKVIWKWIDAFLILTEKIMMI